MGNPYFLGKGTLADVESVFSFYRGLWLTALRFSFPIQPRSNEEGTPSWDPTME